MLRSAGARFGVAAFAFLAVFGLDFFPLAGDGSAFIVVQPFAGGRRGQPFSISSRGLSVVLAGPTAFISERFLFDRLLHGWHKVPVAAFAAILIRSTPLKPETITHVGVSEWRTARHPDALRTTLGSCVGIILYSKKDRAGGMCHALLDEPPPGKIAQKGKYARTAIEELLRELQRQGIDKGSLTARVFGGASMFDTERSKFFHNIGESNVATTRSVLQKENIQIIDEDVGGNCGRTITFFLDDGRILLRAGTQERYIYKS